MLSIADRLGCIKSYDEREARFDVALGDGRVVKALGSGRVQKNMLCLGTEAEKAVLYNVLCVPKLTCNLFSVRATVAKGNAVEFGPNNCCIWDENEKLRGKGLLADKLCQARLSSCLYWVCLSCVIS